MTKAPVLDPFAVFGIERRLDLDERALEQRYLRLSRDNHPDLNRSRGAADCAAILARSAEINDAFRLLKDRWARAQVLLELRAPGVLERHKQLDPDFLLSAMELAEQVALAAPQALAALQQRLAAAEDDAFGRLLAALAKGDLDAAARTLHQSKYVRKARADLAARQQEAQE